MKQARSLFHAGRIPAQVVSQEEEERLQLLRIAHTAAVTIHRTSDGRWCLFGETRSEAVSAGELTDILTERYSS